MEETQIKQIIERQPLHGSALLDPRCKILLLVCIGFVSYFLAGEVVSLTLMLVYGLFIAFGNGEKWAVKMIVFYVIVAYLNALLRYVQVPVLSVIMSVFGVTVLKLIPIVMMGIWILRTTNMDTNRVETRFADGSAVAIDCIVIEDEYGNTPAQRAELDWLLYNRPLEYAQLVLGGEIEHHLSLGCDHGRLED